jgi:hypothetical protein
LRLAGILALETFKAGDLNFELNKLTQNLKLKLSFTVAGQR